MVVKVDEDELIEHWTLVGDELGQVAGKRGATRLGFALLRTLLRRVNTTVMMRTSMFRICRCMMSPSCWSVSPTLAPSDVSH